MGNLGAVCRSADGTIIHAILQYTTLFQLLVNRQLLCNIAIAYTIASIIDESLSSHAQRHQFILTPLASMHHSYSRSLSCSTGLRGGALYQC